MGIVKARVPHTAEQLRPFRPHRKLPEATPGEELNSYVIGVKTNCPKESIDMLGISFPKRLIPAEASLVENRGQYYEYNQLSMLLTDRQVEALQERAEETEIIWQDRDGVFHTGMASKWIVIMPEKDAKPLEPGMYKAGEKPIQVQEELEEVNPDEAKDVLYETQKKGGGKKK